MSSLRLFLLAPLVACTATDDADLDLGDVIVVAEQPTEPGWEIAPTLHADTHILDHVDANSRRVHSLWIGASTTNHVALDLAAHAGADYDVRIAVLGPAVNGVRQVIAADGYASRKRDADVALDISESGEHLVVVGSYGLQTETFYDLAATCASPGGCESRVDLLATPKDGALVGDGQRLVTMSIGDVLANHEIDLEVELWASPPIQGWNAELVGVSEASGTQVNAIVPSTVKPGDDLRLIVREAGGRILDSGIATRFAPQPGAFARLDSIIYGDNDGGVDCDITSLQISGVVGYYEGVAAMVLRSKPRALELARDIQHATRPGQVGNGWGSFDATFGPDLAMAPHNGELLSLGWLDGNGAFREMGCFEYCNHLSGLSTCTGGARTCP